MKKRKILKKLQKLEDSMNVLSGNIGEKLNEKKRDEKVNIKYFVESAKGIFAFTVEAYKSLFLISSGATAALFLFLGYLVNSNKIETVNAVKPALVVFFIASLFTSISFFVTGGAQMYFAEDPFTDSLYRQGYIFKGIAICLVIIAIFCCLIGTFIIYKVYIA